MVLEITLHAQNIYFFQIGSNSLEDFIPCGVRDHVACSKYLFFINWRFVSSALPTMFCNDEVDRCMGLLMFLLITRFCCGLRGLSTCLHEKVHGNECWVVLSWTVL